MRLKRSSESQIIELSNFGGIDKIEVKVIYLFLPKSASNEKTLFKFRIDHLIFIDLKNRLKRFAII